MARKKRRFSLAPVYVAVAIGIAQAVTLHLVPLIADAAGPGSVAPEVADAYRVAKRLDDAGLSPLIVGVLVAMFGIVTVGVLPVTRFLWWLAAVASIVGLLLLLAKLLQPLYMP